MTTPELSELFPDLQPITTAPSLASINGIGTALYGRRDLHAETGTYVKTLAVIVIYVPIIALRAYRVADARNGGWHCLGRVPLSGFARGWNQLLALGLLVTALAVGWHAHTSSAIYRGERLAERMEAAQQAGDLGQALECAGDLGRDYRGVGDLDQRAARVAGTVSEAVLAGDLDRLAADLPRCLAVAERGLTGTPRAAVLERAVARLRESTAQDPARSYRLLGAWAPRPVEGDDAFAADRRAFLAAAVAKAPSDLVLVVDWAGVLEREERPAEVRTLLAPHRGELGDGEGARILGMLLADDGDFAGAHALLWPYARTRLATYHQLEEQWQQNVERVSAAALDHLQNGKADPTWYRRYEGADEAAQKSMVMEWISAELTADAEAKRLQERIAAAGSIVPVGFRLGMVSLSRAGQLAGDERAALLKEAEEAFLAVRGALGESTMYQLHLAEVQCWLGRTDEGDRLFEQILAQGGADEAVSVAEAYRRLGNIARTRAILEAAFAKATDADQRSSLAYSRSMVPKDTDDLIAWIAKDGRDIAETKAKRAQALGHQAYEQGRDDEARRQLREAANLYIGMPENATTLNNAATLLLPLFLITGDPADLRSALRMQREALRLEPDGTILIVNTANTLVTLAVLELVGDRLDYARLRKIPELDDLQYLYGDDASRTAVIGQLRSHPAFVEAAELHERLMLIRPRSPESFRDSLSLRGWTRDDVRCAAIADACAAADLDLSEIETAMAKRRADPQGERTRQLALMRTKRDRLRASKALGGADATAVCAGVQVIAAELAAAHLGEPVDLAALVAESDRLVQLMPCRATSNLRHDAQARRCLAALQAAVPDAGLDADADLDADHALALMASRSPQARAALTGLSECRAWLAALAEQRARFADSGSTFEWYVALQTGSPDAAVIAERVARNGYHSAWRRMNAVIAPWEPGAVSERVLFMRLQGHDAEATALLREAEAHGVAAGLMR